MSSPAPDRVWTIPNLFTFARFICVPVFGWLHATNRPGLALAVFIGAGVSDGLDGLLARALNQRNRLGALLDPIADKLLLVTALCALSITGELPRWFFALAFLREALLGGAALAVWRRGLRVPARPARLGKYGMLFQL